MLQTMPTASTKQWIVARHGRPFADRDAAQIKRDLLAADLGPEIHLDVVDHPNGGFAVAVVPRVSGSAELFSEAFIRGSGAEHGPSPREALERTLKANSETERVHGERQV